MYYRNFFIAMFMLPTVVFGQEYEVCISEAQEPMMTGKYAPTWESLSQYEVPEWFRDGALGTAMRRRLRRLDGSVIIY